MQLKRLLILAPTVLILLLVVVVVPTAGVLWFMTEAMRNERLAVQQREVQRQVVSLEPPAPGPPVAG